VPPATSAPEATSMPEPVCPQGVVQAAYEAGFEEPPAPGTSPLDEGLTRMQHPQAEEEGPR
jgi:hypothetical protein